jgi:ATP-binding cassette, subfamily B, bacterial
MAAATSLAYALRLLLRARPGLAGLYLATALLSGAVPVAAAQLTKLLLDRIVTDAGHADVGPVIAGLAFCGIVAATAADVSQYLSTELDRTVRVEGQERLFDAVTRLPGLRRFEDPSFLDELQLAYQEGRIAPSQMVTGLLRLGQGLVTLLGFLASLLAISPQMAVLVVGATVPVLVAEWALAGRRVRVREENGHAMRREMFYAQTLTDVRAAKEIRLFGIAGFLRGRMRAETLHINAGERRLERRETAARTGFVVLGAVVAALGLWWAATRAAAGELSLGDVTLFVAAVAGTQAAAAAAVLQLAHLRENVMLFTHFVTVVSATADLPVPARPVPPPPLRRRIEFRDVWFRYSEDSPWILRGLNLDLGAGRATALVGVNGAGKSTIVKLLCRFYDPERGSITWDGVDLRDMDPSDLRCRIGAVFQDFMHYDLTAHENIALGDLTAIDQPGRVATAARTAGVDDVLSALPYGYETLLSRMFISETDKQNPRTGIVLSGGQWQRVALARAFVRDSCDVLIMDEPSSGLDAEAEAQVADRLRGHRQGRTSLLISHRLGTLRDADLIAVLADGRIAEQGRHEDLIAAHGIYARLFDLQARGYQDEPDRAEALA